MPYKDPEKRKAYFRKYNKKHYQENKQYYIDKAKRWKKDNPEKVKIQKRRHGKWHYHRNKELYKERNNKWRENNRERHLAWRNKYQKKRHDKMVLKGLCIRCGDPIDEDDRLMNGDVAQCITCRMKCRLYVLRNKYGDAIPLPLNIKKEGKRMPVIGLDIDGVIRDFVGALIKYYKENYPDNRILEVKQWGLHHAFPDHGEKIYNVVFKDASKECLYDAEPYPGAIEFVKKLKDLDYEIAIVTHQTSTEAKCWTWEWLKEHGLIDVVDHVLILSPGKEFDKHTMMLDLILEDCPDNLQNAYNAGITTVCYDRPWNSKWKQGYHVKNYDEFIKLLYTLYIKKEE